MALGNSFQEPHLFKAEISKEPFDNNSSSRNLYQRNTSISAKSESALFTDPRSETSQMLHQPIENEFH